MNEFLSLGVEQVKLFAARIQALLEALSVHLLCHQLLVHEAHIFLGLSDVSSALFVVVRVSLSYLVQPESCRPDLFKFALEHFNLHFFRLFLERRVAGVNF